VLDTQCQNDILKLDSVATIEERVLRCVDKNGYATDVEITTCIQYSIENTTQ